MKRYRFVEAALTEYEAAAAWYIEHSDRVAVARAFIAAVEKAVTQIRRSPQAFQRMPGAEPEVRRCVVRRFPYAVVYVDRRDEILILAIAHTSQAPGYWTRRRR